jgi:hypothetical protein
MPKTSQPCVSAIRVNITSATVGISKSLKLTYYVAREILPEGSSFTVDRNYICAARVVISMRILREMFVSLLIITPEHCM